MRPRLLVGERERRFYPLDPEKIDYIESDGNYVTLFHAKQLDDLGCPAIDQAALASFLGSRQFERHLRQTVEELGNRRKLLLEGLQQYAGDEVEITDSQAGMHVVVWLRRFSYPQLERLIQIGMRNGLGLRPIHPYYKKRPPFPGLLLGFTGTPPQKIVEATKLFGLCLKEALHGPSS